MFGNEVQSSRSTVSAGIVTPTPGSIESAQWSLRCAEARL